MKKHAKTKPSDTVVFLKGKRVTLRPVSEKDAPMFTRWVNDPEVRRYLKRTLPITEGAEIEWIQKLSKKQDNDVVLVIEVKGVPIGIMGIHGINWHNRTATTGALIGEKACWGKGYGTDAKMAVLDYAFNTLGLRKIISRVIAFNERSLAYSLHCGYLVEGRLKGQHFKEGKYHDEIVLGIFKEQWLPKYEAYQKKK
ncbi:MAG: hypothetical protein RLY66_148 [Candidatus Parcubacteria bacterium]|jgi:RimJ/RimL family protein N-acetyltransferase